MALVINSASLGTYPAFIIHRAPGAVGIYSYEIYDDDESLISTVEVETSSSAPGRLGIDLHTVEDDRLSVRCGGNLVLSASGLSDGDKGYFITCDDDNADGVAFDSRILKPGSYFVIQALGTGSFDLNADIYDSAGTPIRSLTSQVRVVGGRGDTIPQLVSVSVDRIDPSDVSIGSTQALQVLVAPFAAITLVERTERKPTKRPKPRSSAGSNRGKEKQPPKQRPPKKS